MSLLETIAGICRTEISPDEYRLTAFGGRCVYAEGVKCVKSFSRTEIILGLKKSCLKITGEGLRIEQFCGGDAVIKGSVKRLETI
ncbi:MAG: YabP/YqfC family sporulation protein [Clostridia bacterium]|nr:YabP/YqfC family sporulation protein [Clostridia bacterium]MBQ9481395.1 YabP/YqfC family sporulation protein [Clostridia bacterium]